MKKVILSALFLAALPSVVQAQEEETPENTFTLSAQLRPRFEYRNGAYVPLQEGEKPAILVNNRTRINFDYRHGDQLQLFLSFQNVNIWGQAPQVQLNDRTGGLSIFEAYAALPIYKDINAKIGRQMIVLDEDRIFGSLDWHPAGRAHDAININWKNDKLSLRSFFAFNQNYFDGKAKDKLNGNVNNPKGQFFAPGGQPYQHLEAVHAHYDITPTQGVSVLVANLGQRNDLVDDNDYNMQTFGFHYRGKSDALRYGAEGYLQTGKNAAGKDKQAFLLAALVGYQFTPAFSATLGLDYLSGNDTNDPTATKDKAFNPFSGTNHKFYGFMDHFYVSYSPSVGLLNPYLNLTLKTSDKGNLSATGHYFRSAGKILGSEDNKTRHLGVEGDLVYTHKIQQYVSLQAGYSLFIPSGTYKSLRSLREVRKQQDWLWCSLNINPKLFTAKF